jgi:hypothetical protein
MGLVYIWVDAHCCRAKHAQTPSAEIPNFDSLESNDRVVVVVETFGLFTPECQSDSVARLVDDLDIALGELQGQLVAQIDCIGASAYRLVGGF